MLALPAAGVADRLSAADVGCWVLKSRTPPDGIRPGWRPGSTRVVDRCLRRTYRVDLMSEGQPCLLWVSGDVDPGVRAVGTVARAARPAEHPDEEGRDLRVDLRLRLLRQPVERRALRADPLLAGAEVLRLPVGANPSYLSPELWSALRELLDPVELSAAGC